MAADEILRSKHAFGALENVDQAITDGKVDSYDILFVEDKNGKPYVGWVNKAGEKVIVDNSAEIAELESELSTKANAEEVKAELATKVSAEEVETKIEASVNSAKAYTDGKVEAAVNEHLVKKYEITNIPEGTLVNYGEKEIRVMCPENCIFTKQTVGETGNANMYYMGFKAYAPEGAVGFKEGDQGVIIDEMFDFNGDFAGTDEYGRNYSICWLALASYNQASDTWTYFGKNSSTSKYIGWTYVVEWYNANGVVIASNSIRINLSNEKCHSTIEPYYVKNTVNEANAYTDEQIAAIINSMAIVEF